MKRLDEQALIEHGRFLKRLAHSLLRDAARADDVVQEAWLAALRTGPRDAAALRPWLVGTVRNLVRRTRREEGRRTRREARAARPDRARPTADVVAHESTRRALLDAVLGLEEPYRTVVLLRYYDGLSPREIARRLGVAGSTVRTRLQRGLAVLRGRLDAEHDGERRAWCLALVPVAAHPVRAATVAGVSSSLGKGLVAMKPKFVVLAVSLCVLAVLLLWRLGDDGDARRSSDGVRPAATASGIDSPPTPAAGELEEAAPPPVAGPPRLRGVVHVPDGLAGEPVELEVFSAGKRSVPATVTAGRPFEADVGALFDGGVPADLVVRARHGATLPARADVAVWIDPATKRPVLPDVELELRAAAIVAGRVTTATPRATVRATIAAFALDGGTPRERAAAKVACEADGAYLLPLEEGGRYLLVAVADGLRPAAQRVDVRAGATTDAAPFRLEPGVSISGRVRLNGAPAAGAWVAATLVEPGLTLKIPGLTCQLRYADTVEYRVAGAATDAEGRYAIGGLAPAAFDVHCASVVDGHHALTSLPQASELERAATAPAGHVDFDVEAAELVVTVVPAAATQLEVTLAGSNFTSTDYVHTDADGRRRFRVRPGARHRVLARRDGHGAQVAELLAPGAGERADVALRFPERPPTATLDVVVEPRTAVRPPLPAGLWFTLTKDGERPFLERALYADGRYIVSDLAPGTYRVQARCAGLTARDGGYYRAASARVVLEAGATESITLDAHAGGRLVVHLRGPDGRTDLEAVAGLTRVAAGEEIIVSYVKYDGSRSMSAQHAIPGLPGPVWVEQVLDPGRYRLTVEVDGFAPRTVEFGIAAGRTAEVAIDLGQ